MSKMGKRKEQLIYYPGYLSLVIDFYIKHALKNSDWQVVAIDQHKDSIVFKRFGKP